MELSHWLRRYGLSGNPFALKQADEEGDLLQACFVEHPSYAVIRDTSKAQPTLIHALRGAGKSSARRMFEEYCAQQSMQERLLVVLLLDWQWTVDAGFHHTLGSSSLYLEALLRQFIVALAVELTQVRITPPTDIYHARYLSWIVHRFDQHLDVRQRELFADAGLLIPLTAIELQQYNFTTMPVVRALSLLCDIVRSLHYQQLVILIDRLDELPATQSDGQASATIITPLIGNLPLIEVPGVSFKFFLPTEVVAVLRARKALRDDRITCIDITWEGSRGQRLLKKLLQRRLEHFSDRQIRSLVTFAPNLRDLDDRIIEAAASSPRMLLTIGDILLQHCAEEAYDDAILITESQVEEALVNIANMRAKDQLRPGIELTKAPVAQSQATALTPAVSLLLRVEANGMIWIGETEFHGWRNLTLLQRKLLLYLYKHHDKLCSIEDLMTHIWDREKVGDPDKLRKLADRLIACIEVDPENPRYIQRVRGGAMVLHQLPHPITNQEYT